MFAIYNLGRIVAARHTGRAFVTAAQLWRFERMLGLPDEQDLQHATVSLLTPATPSA